MNTIIAVNDAESEWDEEMGVRSDSNSGTGQYRSWFFTVNNPSDEWKDGKGWDALQRVFGTIRGGVYQLEKATTLHAQGCFTVETKTRVITMKNKMRSKLLRGWIKPCISFEKSVKYCSKEDTRQAGPFWFGTVTSANAVATQGKRTDLHSVSEAIQAGKSLLEVAKDHPCSFIKYHSGVREYFQLMRQIPERRTMTQLHIHWGVAGAGKSYNCWQLARAIGEVYVLPTAKESHVVWWKDYKGEPAIMLEDYYGWVPLAEMLKMIDENPWKVRTHGDNFVNFNSKHVFISSNSHWANWYSKEFMKEANWKAAFERRITDCTEYTTKYIPRPPTPLDFLLDDAPPTRIHRSVEWDDAEPDRNASPLTVRDYMQMRHATKCAASNSPCDCDAYETRFYQC